PTFPESPSSPNLVLNSAIGLLVGLGLSSVFVLIRDKYDVYVKNEEFLLNRYNIPVLAAIPSFDQKAPKKILKRRQLNAKKAKTLSAEKNQF
ncbi:MAG: hypothetical protein LBS36_06735, partial [Oscillospiraceae bacterium]|nr:hypothetical protein [Oscillospiraceae bacterium]